MCLCLCQNKYAFVWFCTFLCLDLVQIPYETENFTKLSRTYSTGQGTQHHKIDARWSETLKKIIKEKCADIFICRLSLVEYFTDKYFLLQVSSLQGAAMLVVVHSLAMKSRKRLATKYEYDQCRNLIRFCHTCWPCHWWNWYCIINYGLY